jgi:hypothetical protein
MRKTSKFLHFKDERFQGVSVRSFVSSYMSWSCLGVGFLVKCLKIQPGFLMRKATLNVTGAQKAQLNAAFFEQPSESFKKKSNLLNLVVVGQQIPKTTTSNGLPRVLDTCLV